MSAVESALDVLSRAATMVQEERPKAAGTSLQRKPSSAWRRERRRDPIQSEALDMSRSSRPSVIVPVTRPLQEAEPLAAKSSSSAAAAAASTDEQEAAATPTASSASPSPASRGQRTGVRSPGVAASDPAIDEHFKRSLGLKEYAAVFDAADKLASKDAGLTVDDHFAKALGETWTRLQATTRSKQPT